MAEPPPQPDEVVSPDAKWPPYSAIDTGKHMGELKPVIEFPPEKQATDHTADVTDFGPGDSSERQDILSELTEGQRMRLLARTASTCATVGRAARAPCAPMCSTRPSRRRSRKPCCSPR